MRTPSSFVEVAGLRLGRGEPAEARLVASSVPGCSAAALGEPSHGRGGGTNYKESGTPAAAKTWSTESAEVRGFVGFAIDGGGFARVDGGRDAQEGLP